jgi:glycosyltransferase involved in cell wall biosynthesis
MITPPEHTTPRVLLAIPVYNEARYVDRVLTEVRRRIDDVLVIDDGSTDDTPRRLAAHPVEVIRHATNRGYGRSMQDMMRWARFDGFDWLVTMDCDEQHEPAAIPSFLEAIRRDDLDVISGSRYLDPEGRVDAPPPDRRRINGMLTEELDIDGYDFPMQFWVQAVAAGLRIGEIPVRLIYNDPSRSFGGPLDDAGNRLAVYRRTFERELRRCAGRLPAEATADLQACGIEA